MDKDDTNKVLSDLQESNRQQSKDIQKLKRYAETLGGEVLDTSDELQKVVKTIDGVHDRIEEKITEFISIWELQKYQYEREKMNTFTKSIMAFIASSIFYFMWLCFSPLVPYVILHNLELLSKWLVVVGTVFFGLGAAYLLSQDKNDVPFFMKSLSPTLFRRKNVAIMIGWLSAPIFMCYLAYATIDYGGHFMTASAFAFNVAAFLQEFTIFLTACVVKYDVKC